jgi:hypothetical protein
MILANEWRSIDLRISRLEYMMLHDLEDGDSEIACYNSYPHYSAKLWYTGTVR